MADTDWQRQLYHPPIRPGPYLSTATFQLQHGGNPRGAVLGLRSGAKGFTPGPAGDVPGAADGCPGLEGGADGAAADEEGSFGVVLCSFVGTGGFADPGDAPGAAGDCPGVEPLAGCAGAPVDEEGPVCVVLGPPADDDGVGAYTPGGTPGAYEIGCPPEAPADPVCVVLGPPVDDDGVGAYTPGGTPGAYEIGCPPEAPAGEEGGLCVLFGALAAAGGATGGASGGPAGAAADCPGLAPPAGCDGTVSHEAVDGAPPVVSENVLADESTSANVALCCFRMTWSADIATTKASPTRSPTPTT